jgi:hypothetical protein
MSGWLIGNNADIRRFPMTADLAHRSYFSSTLLDTFLEGTPEVTKKHVHDLYKMKPWETLCSKVQRWKERYFIYTQIV